MSALVNAARAVLRDALDAVEVHPCDVHDDAARAKGLIDPMATLYFALAAAPAPTNVHGVDYIMAAVSSFASEWALIGGPMDRGGMLEQAEGTRARIRAMLAGPVPAAAAVPESVPLAHDECWSANEEDFNSGSLGELIDRNDHLEVGATVYVADAEPIALSRLVDAEDVLDTMRDRASDIVGEHADDYPDVDKGAEAELSELLAGWIAKHCPPRFYEVSNVRPYVLTADDIAP